MSEILDSEAIAQMEAVGGPELVLELIELYLDTAPGKLTAIETTHQAADAGALEKAAHALKSSSATLGAREMQRLAGELETAVMGGDLTSAPALIASLQDAYQRLTEALAAQRGRLPGE